MKQGAELDSGKKPPVRVLVADASAVVRTAVKRMLEADGGIQVIGTAHESGEVLQKVAALNPDVVVMDVAMDEPGRLETLREMMRCQPHPVLMLSPPGVEAAEDTLQALDEGAFDYVSKELLGNGQESARLRHELVGKVKTAARAVGQGSSPGGAVPQAQLQAPAIESAVPSQVICIGSSTGGPKALQQILSGLPADLPAAILLVQHMPAGFTGAFAKRLDSLCAMPVREAVREEEIEPGTILVAPAGWHMLVFQRGHSEVRLSKSPEHILHRPSVDVLMISAAEVFQAACMGIILTGMGADGAQGMKAIYAHGGPTVGQDEASCAVYGMPRSCAELGVLQRIVPLREIKQEILLATQYGPRG